MTIKHTDQLKKKEISKQAKWDKAHPYHCRSCFGEGGKEQPATRHEPSDFAYCPDCIEIGLCPLCGSCHTPNDTDTEIDSFNAWLETEEPCKFCNERFGPSTMRPFDDGEID